MRMYDREQAHVEAAVSLGAIDLRVGHADARLGLAHVGALVATAGDSGSSGRGDFPGHELLERVPKLERHVGLHARAVVSARTPPSTRPACSEPLGLEPAQLHLQQVAFERRRSRPARRAPATESG